MLYNRIVDKMRVQSGDHLSHYKWSLSSILGISRLRA
jgi:hypothetical protein